MSSFGSLKRSAAAVSLDLDSPSPQPAQRHQQQQQQQQQQEQQPVFAAVALQPAPEPAAAPQPAPAAAAAPQPVLFSDPELAGAANNVCSKYYLWTVCSNEAGYKQPAEIGKIGLYQALGRAFKHVFSNPEDANHNGPEYGKVVQEGGHLTAQSDHEKIRTCMALRLLLVIISGKLSKFTSPSTRRSRPPFLDFLVFWLWVSYILVVCS